MVQFQILTGKQAGQEFQARRFPYHIGRSAHCDLSLEEPGLWDRHLTVRLQHPDGFIATAHNEALATINDESFKSVHLRNGDIIGLGSLKVLFGLSATRSQGLRLREYMTWLGFAALFIGQLALIYLIPN